jgi:hypothetical protein
MKYIIISILLITIYCINSSIIMRNKSIYKPGYVKLFWTGGYDSTFRLLQLVIIEKKYVNPIYLNFDNLDGPNHRRQNINFELQTMQKIINELINLGYGNQIAPLIIIKHINLSPDVKKSCKIMYDNGDLRRPVSQYSHMIQLSLDLNCIIEECAEKSTHSTSYKMLHDKLDNNKLLNLDLIRGTHLFVLRNIRFPIIDLTKKDMLVIAKLHKFDYILKWTKSCWWPNGDGSPCKKCLMCRTRKEELPFELQESFK